MITNFFLENWFFQQKVRNIKAMNQLDHVTSVIAITVCKVIIKLIIKINN